MITFENLMEAISCKKDIDSLKNSSGIYKVYLPKETKIIINSESDAVSTYKGRSLLYPVDILEEKLRRIQSIEDDDKYILYIGKARQRLKKRIYEYVKHGYGKCKTHRGGRAIWQLENNKQFLIEWFECEHPEEQEKKELKKYLETNKVLPFANWRI